MKNQSNNRHMPAFAIFLIVFFCSLGVLATVNFGRYVCLTLGDIWEPLCEVSKQRHAEIFTDASKWQSAIVSFGVALISVVIPLIVRAIKVSQSQSENATAVRPAKEGSFTGEEAPKGATTKAGRFLKKQPEKGAGAHLDKGKAS